MSRTITVGLDGSPESRAAAEWAAREAASREVPLRLVYVREPAPAWTALALPPDAEQGTAVEDGGDGPRETADGLRLRHPGLDVTVEQYAGDPGEALVAVADRSELLALGSRGLGGIRGFLVGSVGLAVVARAGRPVVLVRAGEQAADEHEMDPAGIPSAATPCRPVVLGVDGAAPDDAVLSFAFEEAARRETAVRAVRAWTMPPYYVYGTAADPDFGGQFARQEEAALSEVLQPWRQKYPSVEVIEDCGAGSASVRLIDASHEASMVVVGRRTRRARSGARIGPVTHAVLHHATAPVAVVPHD